MSSLELDTVEQCHAMLRALLSVLPQRRASIPMSVVERYVTDLKDTPVTIMLRQNGVVDIELESLASATPSVKDVEYFNQRRKEQKAVEKLVQEIAQVRPRKRSKAAEAVWGDARPSTVQGDSTDSATSSSADARSSGTGKKKWFSEAEAIQAAHQYVRQYPLCQKSLHCVLRTGHTSAVCRDELGVALIR